MPTLERQETPMFAGTSKLPEDEPLEADDEAVSPDSDGSLMTKIAIPM